MVYAIGERISDFREQQGRSQSALATLMSVNVSTISRWESGKIVPGPAHIRRLRDLGFQLPLVWGPMLNILVNHHCLIAGLYTGAGEVLLAASRSLRCHFRTAVGAPWTITNADERRHFDFFHETLVEHGLYRGALLGMRARFTKDCEGRPLEARATWRSVLLPDWHIAVLNLIRLSHGDTDAPRLSRACIEEVIHG